MNIVRLLEMVYTEKATEKNDCMIDEKRGDYMTRIYLIRHAEAEGNLYRIAQGHENGLLTRRGWQQVEALSRRFAPIHIDAVYASDLYRTCATASAIYKPKGLPLHKDSELREAYLGVWEGQPWGEISRRDAEQLVNFSIHTHLWRVEKGETALQVQARLEAAVRRIAKAHDGQTIAIASHGFAIRMLLGKLQGYPIENIGDSPQEDNTAVSLLELEGDELRLVYRGDNSHLHTGLQKIGRKRASALEDGMYYEPVRLPEQAELYGEMAAAARAEAGETPLSEDKLMQEGRFRLFGFNGRESPSALLEMEDTGRITLLYVRPGEREQGLGVQLIGQAVQQTMAQGGKTLHITLRRDNPARALLEENSFAPVQELPDGRVVLEKDLDCSAEI